MHVIWDGDWVWKFVPSIFLNELNGWIRSIMDVFMGEMWL
jgi:hypothetical protein